MVLKVSVLFASWIEFFFQFFLNIEYSIMRFHKIFKALINNILIEALIVVSEKRRRVSDMYTCKKRVFCILVSKEDDVDGKKSYGHNYILAQYYYLSCCCYLVFYLGFEGEEVCLHSVVTQRRHMNNSVCFVYVLRSRL